jgi:predicted kinase
MDVSDARDQHARHPVLAVVAGLPGAGKTTLALALGRALGWPVLDKDTIKSALLDLDFPDPKAGWASYALLPALARDLIGRQRQSVILDGPFIYPDIVARVLATAEECGAWARFILCQAGKAVRDRRVTVRTPVRSQWTAPRDGYAGDGAEHFLHLPPDRLALDTDRPLDALVDEALRYLKA